MRVNVANRHRNSHRADEARRFPSHLAWLRKRPCLLAGKPGHDCEGKIEAAHVDHAGGKGMSLKVADYHTVPLCSMSHASLHMAGPKTWQMRHGVNLIDAAAAYAKASPHRHLWEADRG